MNTLLIFIWVLASFIVMAFLDAIIEGPNPQGRKTYGWKFKITKNISLTEYHLYFWAFIIMLALLPLIIYGFDKKVFGILISAFSLGFTLEDFAYFIVNPYFGLKKFNSKIAKWYPWIKIGKIEFPLSYIIEIGISVLSWYFLWR